MKDTILIVFVIVFAFVFTIFGGITLVWGVIKYMQWLFGA